MSEPRMFRHKDPQSWDDERPWEGSWHIRMTVDGEVVAHRRFWYDWLGRILQRVSRWRLVSKPMRRRLEEWSYVRVLSERVDDE